MQEMITGIWTSIYGSGMALLDFLLYQMWFFSGLFVFLLIAKIAGWKAGRKGKVQEKDPVHRRQ